MQAPAPKRNSQRTRERILDASLRLFNALGEPNVSVNAIAENLGISTGNLTYHFRSKADIVVALFDRFEDDWAPCDQTPGDRPSDLAQLHRFIKLSTEAIWRHRFVFRDLNELSSRNRRLELRVACWIDTLTQRGRVHLTGMAGRGVLRASPGDIASLLDHLVIVSCYWLSYEATRHARRFGDPGFSIVMLARGRHRLLALLGPHLSIEHRPDLDALIEIEAAVGERALTG